MSRTVVSERSTALGEILNDVFNIIKNFVGSSNNANDARPEEDDTKPQDIKKRANELRMMSEPNVSKLEKAYSGELSKASGDDQFRGSKGRRARRQSTFIRTQVPTKRQGQPVATKYKAGPNEKEIYHD